MTRDVSVSAFSLVEVTIAIALVAFGIIAIMGLLPVGLQQMKESSSESVAVNILSDLAGQIENAEANGAPSKIPLVASGSGVAYLDVNGQWLGAGSAPPDAVYAARWNVRTRDLTTGAPPNVILTVGWPALAETPSGSVEILTILNNDPALP